MVIQIRVVDHTHKNYLTGKHEFIFRDWYKFNIYQRVHQNYVESLSFAQTSLLSAAIYKPKEAAAVGLLFIVGRIIYSFFYKKEKGALNKGRILGSILSLLAIFVNSGIFFTNFFKSLK